MSEKKPLKLGKDLKIGDVLILEEVPSEIIRIQNKEHLCASLKQADFSGITVKILEREKSYQIIK